MLGGRLQQPTDKSAEPTPIFMLKVLDRCHVVLPDMATPTSAIAYEGDYYIFVKFFPNADDARRKADQMVQRGGCVLLTRVPKGVVLWVLEPDAQKAEPKGDR